MEYRKLISFGKSSFVVSLPKSWVNQNKLKKGDLIYLEENGQNMILSKNENKDAVVDKIRTINIDGKDIRLIAREVNSSYILNYRTIILKGKEIKDRIKEIQTILQNLIALEVMEQTSNSIVAKDFLNMEQVSIDEVIRKMDIIARTMLKESVQNVLRDNYENINDRDKDVNRLYFLLYRAVLYNMEHLSAALKRLKMTPMDLLNHQFIGFYIEGVADEARRIARHSRNLKLSSKEKNNLMTFYGKIEQYYLDTMRAIYERDYHGSLRLSCIRESINSDLDLLEKNNVEFNFMIMVSRMRRMLSYVHSLGRMVYQGITIPE
ncbi:MAG: phosphate uptake regulator PhoU [Candidatus Woesearchaeota archaeon]|jgi:phosphate uptake regulator